MAFDPIEMAKLAFPAQPDRIALYPVAVQQDVLAALRQDVIAGQHLLCLIGPAGSGKTALLRALRQNLTQGLVGLIELPTPGRLVADLAMSLQLHTEDGNETNLRRQLVMRLSMVDQQSQPIIQIVDAADRLPKEDLNLLLHFFPPGHATLILAAAAEPETWLDGCASSAGEAHIDCRYHLDALSAEETESYIRYRLRMVGLPDDLFPPATLAAIHRHSDGLPGLINQFSAAALAQTDAQTAQDNTVTTITPAPERVEDLPQVTVDEADTVQVELPPMLERRHRYMAWSRPLVAPRNAVYAVEPPTLRTRHLQRSLKRWRALAVIASAAFAIVLTRDAWIDGLPSGNAFLDGLAEFPFAPQTAGQPIRKPARSGPSGSRTRAAEQSDETDRNSDFAAMYTPSVLRRDGVTPLVPSADDVKTLPPQAMPTQPASPPEPAGKPGSEPAADTASSQVDPSEQEQSDIRAASPASVSKARPRAGTQRPEIARLYAMRAEYEWRNGELYAAYVSIKRGLAYDPGNPRLLEMRALYRQFVEEERHD